jgi:hypothetical protein
VAVVNFNSWHNATLPYSNFHSSVALAESDSPQTPTDSPVVSEPNNVKSDWINTKHDSKTGPFPSDECTSAGLGRAAAEGRRHCPAFPPPFPPFHSKSNTKNNKAAVARALDFPKNTPKGKGIMKGARLDHPKVSNDKTLAMHEDGVRIFLNGKFTGIITRWIDCTPDMRAGRGQKLHYYCTR